MVIISTPALKKITIFVLVIAVVSFGAAEIHKRFIVPRQQATVPTPIPTPTQPEVVSKPLDPLPRPTPPFSVIPGQIKKIEDRNLTLDTSEGEKGPYTVPQNIPVYRLDPRNPESSFPFSDMYSDDFSQKSAVSESAFSGIKVGEASYLVFEILPNEELKMIKVVVFEVIKE